ncbi:MAG: S41 family peptidase [Saprospiraceae bacterium]|nr:S41 family peptidase [Saprospiraceae bacterium]
MKNIIIIFLFTITFTSCEAILFEDDPSADPVATFEALWKELDEGYSFFEYKNINWDSVYNVYRPKVNANTKILDLYNIMSDMLYTLRDGHVNLDAGFNRTRNWEWFLGYPPNFDEDLLQRNYWKDQQWYTGALVHTVIDSTIGYVRYGSFASQISESQIDLVIARFQNAKGIIIDLRDNGGGFSNLPLLLASRFTDKRRLGYTFVVKNGPEHNEFSTPVEVYIEPKGERQYTKPVVILTNRMCYSATNFFVAIMQSFPNVKIIGDQTGGGGGTPVSGELPNGWIVRYSSTQSFTPDGFNIEGGIPPDIKVDMTESDRLKGKDTILERAIAELK